MWTTTSLHVVGPHQAVDMSGCKLHLTKYNPQALSGVIPSPASKNKTDREQSKREEAPCIKPTNLVNLRSNGCSRCASISATNVSLSTLPPGQARSSLVLVLVYVAAVGQRELKYPTSGLLRVDLPCDAPTQSLGLSQRGIATCSPLRRFYVSDYL